MVEQITETSGLMLETISSNDEAVQLKEDVITDQSSMKLAAVITKVENDLSSIDLLMSENHPSLSCMLNSIKMQCALMKQEIQRSVTHYRRNTNHFCTNLETFNNDAHENAAHSTARLSTATKVIDECLPPPSKFMRSEKQRTYKNLNYGVLTSDEALEGLRMQRQEKQQTEDAKQARILERQAKKQQKETKQQEKKQQKISSRTIKQEAEEEMKKKKLRDERQKEVEKLSRVPKRPLRQQQSLLSIPFAKKPRGRPPKPKIATGKENACVQ